MIDAALAGTLREVENDKVNFAMLAAATAGAGAETGSHTDIAAGASA
jgi:hypothetical protein